ncbi:hypothetical protein PILCRDRAFT_829150 [Piloderma croceum F 1598]|uniref:Uncharacterized protein n=1 Tax=Piloderma croceum (strain F 1598) TaxID=765440 RepID=A0A0C3B848_PILCF|nr:hypothetical protein PILCRDRAFT_829150 [Piloderma croceum F 1598]
MSAPPATGYFPFDSNAPSVFSSVLMGNYVCVAFVMLLLYDQGDSRQGVNLYLRLYPDPIVKAQMAASKNYIFHKSLFSRIPDCASGSSAKYFPSSPVSV